MGNETRAHGLIGACTFNGGSLAVVLSMDAHAELGRMVVHGQGHAGPDVNTFVTFMRRVVLTFVGQAPFALETKGSLVVSLIRANRTTVDTYTWSNMKAFEDGESAAHATGQHDSVTQQFEYEGDGATDNLSVSYAS